MWRNWFFYTRSERRAIVLILLLIIVLLSFVLFIPRRVDTTPVNNTTVAMLDTLMRRVRNGDMTEQYNRVTKRNTANVDNKNMTSGKSKPVYEKRVYASTQSVKRDTMPFVRQEKFTEGIIIDVNTADTLIFMKIPGIGKSISRAIVSYRNRLGGFYSVNQLLEIKYIDSTFLKWFCVTPDGVFRKIRVNNDGIDALRRHPYMDFYKAKAIIDYRRKRGNFNNISQLSMLKEFSEQDIERLRFYISFD